MFTTLLIALAFLLPTLSAPQKPQDNKYFLRVFDGSQPWHKHPITLLPTNNPGIQNLSTVPQTPPLYFTLTTIPGSVNRVALEVLHANNNDESDKHWLTAIQASSSLDAKIAIMPGADPSNAAANCPPEEKCVADGWTWAMQRRGGNGTHQLMYGGTPGTFTAVREEGVAGWDIYWERSAGMGRAIRIQAVYAGDGAIVKAEW
ncbi:hypothetical protein CC78DRAFT_544467 [Lojkania enalia]|uniref:Uncharacterized protein n=1 Tax=Lojkania enalia TaxID=147567 RepID=A0A9P4N3Y9_9PLEO|nr:hypothetical protein CC78DRAFT_544467 [Didymosphaeria enalia]